MLSETDFQTAAQGICPGPDLEWFAVDECGNIGAFCNAGFAAVPSPVFASFDLYRQTLDAIASLPTTGDATWYRSAPPIHDTWDVWSQRGLFGFDWNHCIGQPDPSLPYRLMTRPSVPITISSFSDDVANYLSSNRLPVADFFAASEILV